MTKSPLSPTSAGSHNAEHSLEGNMLPDLHFSFRLFAAHRRKVDKDWSYPEHSHALFELNWVLEGTQRMTVEGRDLVQRTGDLLLLLPGLKHASLGTADGETMEYLCLHFEVDDPWMRQQLGRFSELLHARDSRLEQRLRPILEEWISATAHSEEDGLRLRFLSMQASFRLFDALCGLLMSDDQADAKPAAAASSALASRLAASIEALAAQTADARAERLGIERIAQRLGYSPAYCSRVFQQTYGMSPRQYLTTIKLREAKLLLMNPALSIEQVALQLGYHDLSQFSKQFKRWTNMSPTAYRHLSY